MVGSVTCLCLYINIFRAFPYIVLFYSFCYSAGTLADNSTSVDRHFFKNFGNSVIIDSQKFTIVPEVIIKTKLGKQSLIAKLNKPAVQLAFLENSNLFLVKSTDPLTYSQELSTKSYIIYAQPNILQKRFYSFTGSNDISTKELVKHYKHKMLQHDNFGEGVNIAIIDDGFNLNHEDLISTQVIFSYDANLKRLTSKPQDKLDTHGTKVAGIIFAKHNNIGINGIAPHANLIAIRQTINLTSDTILALTVAAKAGADIINCSWNSPLLLEPIYDVIKHLSSNVAIVYAAGNQHQEIKPYSIEASIEEVITVGATQSYSNYGDLVDFFISGNLETTLKNGGYGNFNGTSAAAPVISGLLALQLSNNKHKSISSIVENMKRDLNER
ncbi:S8 family serine peptidase [Colwellia sp. E2M01]|uniref:S8 family peptidase n=1 Tax=Colwellia sp. E2M01 TaxID=2841561 RepID=UPI001C0A0C0F|nr:S8 family serine peptidase [Colwellia sp. E2M01]MBU2870609.1 S8 family serine peptidase [Colwellia sp. E2M01]